MLGSEKRPVVYISGPDFLFADGGKRLEKAVSLCEQYGFKGVAGPMTPAPAKGTDKHSEARRLYRETLEAIDGCDIIVANCNEFRGGYQPHAGTAFELGYAYMRGKKLYCYLSDLRACSEKYGGTKGHYEDGTECDEEGRWFEPDCLNLMLWAPSTIVGGGFEEAIRAVAKDLQRGEETS